MAIEIERKFLLKNDAWKALAGVGKRIAQGYLSLHKERTVRVRISNDKAWLTVKGKTVNTTRLEFEYEIPIHDAQQLLRICENPIVDKMRYIVVENTNIWEIDVFEGANEGLVVAEIELHHEEQALQLPNWIGEEVSADPRYYNVNLIKHPFKNW